MTDHVLAPSEAPEARLFLTPRLLLTALRPKQWTKNLLLFIGLVFSLNFGRPTLLVTAAIAFLAFCALSSAGYLLNDILDAAADRSHPAKRLRPVASGALPQRVALQFAGLLAAAALLVAVWISLAFAAVAVLYLLLTVSYSLGLKHLVLIDVFVIAAGFVVRAAAGAIAISVPISPWLYVCTALAALFIALAKRRSEIGLLISQASTHRRNLDQYTAELLDQLITIVLATTVMAYTLYTFTAENLPRNHSMMLTVPPVVYGLFRYLYLVRVQGLGGTPEDLVLADRGLAATALVWVLLSVVILYLS